MVIGALCYLWLAEWYGSLSGIPLYKVGNGQALIGRIEWVHRVQMG